jgi:hypothetical protein
VNIIAHDENSLTNLFFSEIHRYGTIAGVLRKIQWRNHDQLPFEVASAELHQQIGLSEFGKPDATLIVTDPGDVRHVVFIEGKLGGYLASAGPTRGGLFDNRFNSKINNQLTLRYRAMQCLERLGTRQILSELPHTAPSPYLGDKVRRCKKLRTIQLLTEKVVQFTHRVYLVALTMDVGNIFRDLVRADHELSPLFFDEEASQRDEFQNLGSLSWRACKDLLDPIEGNFFTASYAQLEPQLVGRPEGVQEGVLLPQRFRRHQLVEYRGERCLLFCKNLSYSLSAWRTDRFVEVDRGKNDRRKYASLRDRVRLLDQQPAHWTPIQDAESWTRFFAGFQQPPAAHH